MDFPSDDRPAAIADIQVLASMRRLQVAFPTFAPRQPRTAAITSSGCVPRPKAAVNPPLA